MITEGSLQVIAKMVENIGVVGFWYKNSLELILILLGAGVVSVLALIGLSVVLKFILKGKSKKKYY